MMTESDAWGMMTGRFHQVMDFLHEALEHGMLRPSVLYKPRLCQEGNQFCFTLGEWPNGCCVGFGDTVEKAAADFDKNWVSEKLVRNQAHSVSRDKTSSGAVRVGEPGSLLVCAFA
jgi:hypothetical protein